MLCYEPNTNFCHRHIVAAWFEILLGVSVPEVVLRDSKIEEIDRPQYIKQYLEDVIKIGRKSEGLEKNIGNYQKIKRKKPINNLKNVI